MEHLLLKLYTAHVDLKQMCHFQDDIMNTEKL